MEFYEVIKTHRSVRLFEQDPIPENVLRKVLEAARIAPSGSNRQPWKFILVRDETAKKKLAAACSGQAFIVQAPVIIVAVGRNIRYNRGNYMGDMSFLIDVAISVDHLILAARNEGLGTCWIGSFDNQTIKRLLQIPEDLNVVAVIPVGYPKGMFFKETELRKPLEEIICTDRYS